MQRRRLVVRFLGAFVLTSAVATLLLAWLASQRLDESVTADFWKRLEMTGEVAALQLPTTLPTDPEKLAATLQPLARASETRLTIIARDGRVLFDTEQDARQIKNHADRPEVQQALSGTIGHDQHYSNTLDQRMLYVAVPLKGPSGQQPSGVVRASTSAARRDQAVHSAQQGIFISAVALVALAGLIGWILARGLLKPLDEMTAAAQRLADGELATRVPLPETAELATLADAINRLARQLEEHGWTIGRQGHEQEAVLGSMLEGVLAVDTDERIISLNRAAANLIGSKLSDLAGRSLHEIIRNADLRQFAAAAVHCDEPIEDDIELHEGIDKPRILQVRGTALRDAAGRSVGAVIVLNDVTHFRHLENIRIDFVANVSHELKTPIASIKGFVETLLDGAVDDPHDARRFLNIVAKQSDRLNAIIEDLLSLSKIEQSEDAGNLQVEIGPLAPVVELAVHDCLSKATERNVAVRVECPPQLCAPINGPLLEQAIVNLLDNAIKYSEPGSQVLVDAEQHDGEIVLHVIDHGVGIEAQFLPRIFERFYRVDKARSRKLGGTGLGLSIVKHIVQAHQGRVTVTSTAGLGSTFSIYLPAAPPQPASGAASQHAGS